MQLIASIDVLMDLTYVIDSTGMTASENSDRQMLKMVTLNDVGS